MYVRCSCGSSHWGAHGAAGLLLTDPDRTGVLLQLRSTRVHQGGTWSVPGGALERRESAVDAALREAREEAGLRRRDLTVLATVDGIRHPEWSYRYVLAETHAPRPTDDVLPPAGITASEAEQTRWVDLTAVAGYRLHPGLHQAWPRLIDELFVRRSER